MKILIALATYERPKITELCLKNLQLIRLNKNIRLIIYDDASSQYDMPYLLKYSDEVIKFARNGGIERSRARAFRDFIHRFKEFDLLYLTDNDSIHDPIFTQYLIELFTLQRQENESWPVGLFNSSMHKEAIVNENEHFYLYKTCPGISQCYDRSMATRIVSYLDSHPTAESDIHWDFKWPSVLESNFLIPKISYVEHFARDVNEGGLHSAFTGNNKEAFLRDFERDCAINPSQYLVKIKEQVIQDLFTP
jgi:hypothetical protein